MSAICEIMNINVDFKILVNVSHNVFLKRHKNTNKVKPIFFFENCEHTFIENAIILICAKIQRKILMFGEVGAPEISGTEKKTI